MSHHHRIIVPTVTDRPTCAGEWQHSEGKQLLHIIAPDEYEWIQMWRPVLVTETPAAGRLCKELRMGGSALCGLAPWSGQWRKAA